MRDINKTQTLQLTYHKIRNGLSSKTQALQRTSHKIKNSLRSIDKIKVLQLQATQDQKQLKEYRQNKGFTTSSNTRSKTA